MPKKNKVGRPFGTSLLSPQEAADVYVRYKLGEGSVVLARSYGASDQTIRNVVRFRGPYGTLDFKPLMLAAWEDYKPVKARRMKRRPRR